MNQKPFDYLSTINFPTDSTSQSAQSTRSGPNNNPPAFAQGFYFNDGGLQKPDQPQVSPNDPMIGQQHLQDGFRESKSFVHMGGSVQPSNIHIQINQNMAREHTATTASPAGKWESAGQEGKRVPEQHGMIMPDGMKMNMNNQNARQYAHGSFQGSSASSAQGLIRCS